MKLQHCFSGLLAAAMICATVPAFADWDAALEAREEARRQGERAAEAKRAAQAQHIQAEGARQALAKMGINANGKSDTEVIRLYHDETEKITRAANDPATRARYQAEMDAARKMERETRPERDAAMKSMTGKSIQELENMSDEDMEKFANEMEKKFGQ